MSDSHPRKERVIKIKPLQSAVDALEEVEQEQSSNPSAEMVQQEINTLQDEIKTLYEKKTLVIKETKAEIEQERQEWVEEKETLSKQAKEEGYVSGFQQGKRESIQQYEQLLNKANSIILTANEEYTKKVMQSEEVILQLTIHMAQKIIATELKEHADSFVSLVNEAIQEVKNYQKIFIYVHPDQYEIVLQAKTELVQTIGDHAELTILIDYSLKENSCVIEHPYGRIDASVDTQLEIIKNHLIELGKDSK